MDVPVSKSCSFSDLSVHNNADVPEWSNGIDSRYLSDECSNRVR